MGLFSLFSTPLGYVLHWIYSLVPNFFIAIMLFTLLMRLILFPLSISGQKNQADRARLAPRLERIQKKYAADRQKMALKQQELYEKEGVKMTPGCLPMLLQMLVLFSIIGVIYKPLTYVQRMPQEDIDSCVTAITAQLDPNKKEDKNLISRYSEGSYYRELYLMKSLEKNEDAVLAQLQKDGKTPEQAQTIVDTMLKTRKEFSFLGVSLLDVPSEYGIKPNWLWLIVLASGGTALLTSMLSMHYSKASMSKEQQQMGGCTTNVMMYMMPLMSLGISFTVPAGVAVYWTFSNLLAMVQTAVLNKMYNPAKIRAQAEAEYAERRRKRAEDKARLKAARLQEQAAWQKEENEKRAAAQGKGKKKPASAPTAGDKSENTADKPASTPATPADKPDQETP